MKCSLIHETPCQITNCRLKAKEFAVLFKWDLSPTKREELMLFVFDVIIRKENLVSVSHAVIIDLRFLDKQRIQFACTALVY